MKSTMYRPHAFTNRPLVVSLFVILAGTILAGFASTRPHDAGSRFPGTKSVADIRGSTTAARKLPAASEDFWTQTNGPQGGDGIALTRNSLGYVFVGTQGGGVFRS